MSVATIVLRLGHPESLACPTDNARTARTWDQPFFEKLVQQEKTREKRVKDTDLTHYESRISPTFRNPFIDFHGRACVTPVARKDSR